MHDIYGGVFAPHSAITYFSEHFSRFGLIEKEHNEGDPIINLVFFHPVYIFIIVLINIIFSGNLSTRFTAALTVGRKKESR